MEEQNNDHVSLLGQEEKVTTMQTNLSKIAKLENEAKAGAPAKVGETINMTEQNGPTHNPNDPALQENCSSLSNVQVEETVFNGDPEIYQQPTLLHQALTYRQQNPEKWQQSQLESMERLKESYGIYEESPFIEAYYKRQEELIHKTKKMEEIRKTLVKIEIVFFFHFFI